MAEARQYRYVSYKASSRGLAGWVAKVRQDGLQVTLGGVHKNQQLAAKAAAQHLGISVGELRLSKPPGSGKAESSSPVGRPLKQYIYRRGNSFWVSKDNSYKGSFNSLAEAENKTSEEQVRKYKGLGNCFLAKNAANICDLNASFFCKKIIWQWLGIFFLQENDANSCYLRSIIFCMQIIWQGLGNTYFLAQ